MDFVFRLITPEDLPSMLKWGGHFDPRLEHYSFRDFDLDDIRNWYHAKQKFLTRKLYGLISDHTVIGFITLKKINFIYRTAEIGIAVNPDEHGKGYGTQLIKELISHVYSTFPIETVFLDVAEFNTNARKLYEKCGFMYVGEDRKLYENQQNPGLIADFPNDFFQMENKIYANFLRMSYQKSTITEYAPAKINLGLRVVGKNDRYHDLVTTMVTADFADIIHVRANKKSPGIRILSHHEGIEEQQNLCYRAAKIFREHVDFTDEECRNSGIEISIYKRIPEGAGMGGGSADAAAVLRALNRLYGYPFSKNQLEELALKLGSDVPFCVGGGAAIAKGRGERLEDYIIEKPLHILIYRPSVKLATAAVFEEYDRMKDTEKNQKREYILNDISTDTGMSAVVNYADSAQEISLNTKYSAIRRMYKKSVSENEAYIEALRLKSLIGKEEDEGCTQHYLWGCDSHDEGEYVSIYEKLIRTIPPNDLEHATHNFLHRSGKDFKNSPTYAINLLREHGAVYAAMSGSGPSVYGIFESERDARKAQKKLPKSIYSIIKHEENRK